MATTPSWTMTLAFDRYVVTGGGSGIGRAIALGLAEAGATVYVLGRRLHRLEETASLAPNSTGAIHPVVCDLTVPEQVERAFETMDGDRVPIGGLVHSAAQTTHAPARDLTPAAFDEVIASTLLASFYVTRRWALPLIDQRKPGSALLLTSAGSRGTPGVVHSSSGKAGVETMVRTLAREWGTYGIQLNSIGPGIFPVDMSKAVWADPDVTARNLPRIALGRYGELHEMVGPAMFFMSKAASYITGQHINVEGGVTLPPWPTTPEDMARGLNNQYDPLP